MRVGQCTQDYALTVTLQPKYHKLSVEEQYDLLNNQINIITKRYPNVFLTLVVELTKSFNIHAHGFIKSPLEKTALRKMYDIFRNDVIIGYIYIKPIDDHSKWLEYICKDIDKTRESMYCRLPVIIDQFDYLPSDLYYKAIKTDIE